MRHDVLLVDLLAQVSRFDWPGFKQTSGLAFADVLSTVPGFVIVAITPTLILAWFSIRIDAHLSDKRSAVCKAKRIKDWSTLRVEGEFSHALQSGLSRLTEPHVVEVCFSDGRRILSAVSPLLFARLKPDETLSKRTFRTLERHARSAS